MACKYVEVCPDGLWCEEPETGLCSHFSDELEGTLRTRLEEKEKGARDLMEFSHALGVAEELWEKRFR